MRSSKLKIQCCDSQSQYVMVQQLHQKIWGLKAIDITPTHIYGAAINNGGVLLLAFSDNKPIGFNFGLSSKVTGEPPYFYSHNLGVLSKYRGKGIGLELKLAMAKEVRRKRIDNIRWTFDPLDTRNAHLYINKLGGEVIHYQPNYFGIMTDQINKDFSSDRLIINWNLKLFDIKFLEQDTFKSISQLNLDSYQSLIETHNEDSFLQIIKVMDIHLCGHSYKIPIPLDINRMKAKQISLAKTWDAAVGTILKKCYQNGFKITGIYYDRHEFYYLLKKAS